MNRELPMTKILPSNWMEMRRDWSLLTTNSAPWTFTTGW